MLRLAFTAIFQNWIMNSAPVFTRVIVLHTFCKAEEVLLYMMPHDRCDIRQVLSQRHGSVISRRTILKSYQPTADGSGNALHIKGVHEIRSERA